MGDLLRFFKRLPTGKVGCSTTETPSFLEAKRDSYICLTFVSRSPLQSRGRTDLLSHGRELVTIRRVIENRQVVGVGWRFDRVVSVLDSAAENLIPSNSILALDQCLLNQHRWGISSVGRAFGWQPKGRRFEPVILHSSVSTAPHEAATLCFSRGSFLGAQSSCMLVLTYADTCCVELVEVTLKAFQKSQGLRTLGYERRLVFSPYLTVAVERDPGVNVMQ